MRTNNIKLKSLLIMLGITLMTITGCSSEENAKSYEQARVIPEQSDLFLKIEKENTDNTTDNSIENEYTEQEIQEQKDAETVANELLTTNTEVSNQLRNDCDLNKEDALSLNIEDYSWYIREDADEFQDNGHKYVIYALTNYFDNNITEKIYCKLPDDVIEMPTGSLFNIRVRLESGSTIDCYIDLFNNKIQITENK